LTEKADLTKVQTLVENEVDKLAKVLVSPAELAKVKRRRRSAFVFGLQTNMSRATNLGEFESQFGDARLLTRELQQYQAVTAEQIQQAVKKYLGKERRQVVEVLPAEAPAAPAAPATAPPTKPAEAPKGGKP
jgi:zinc protease